MWFHYLAILPTLLLYRHLSEFFIVCSYIITFISKFCNIYIVFLLCFVPCFISISFFSQKKKTSMKHLDLLSVIFSYYYIIIIITFTDISLFFLGKIYDSHDSSYFGWKSISYFPYFSSLSNSLFSFSNLHVSQEKKPL